MDELEKLIEYMWEELHDCEKYTKEAMLYKEENPHKADTYNQNAKEEYTHFERLHSLGIKCLNNHRDKDGNIPNDIHTIWEWEVGKLMDKAMHVKGALSMVR